MKYKIVQQNYFDEYSGGEETKYYIKKKHFLGIWYYTNLSNDKTDRIFGNIMRWLVTIFVPLILVPLFALFKIGGILFLISIPTSYFTVKYVSGLLFRERYSSLNKAQEDIIKELKRREFKNKSVDIIEISTDSKKITVEKNNFHYGQL